MSPLRLAILISGRGSNMQALIKACKRPDFPARPVLVLANRPDAGGLDLARLAGIETALIDHRTYKGDRAAFEADMHTLLEARSVDLIALAGVMRILTPFFVEKWQGRMINIHPSLLPRYPGLNTHERALAAGDRVAGCTVHWVSEGVDEGDIVLQGQVPVLPDDTAESLQNRVLQAEHVLYPAALEKAAQQIHSQMAED